MPLVLTLMLGVVLAALGSAMAIAAATDTMIAGAHRDGTVLFYAADAAAEFAIGELARSEWSEVLESLDGSAAYTLYASGTFGDILGRAPTDGDPRLTVSIADLTDPPDDGSPTGRVVGIRALAVGRTVGRRSVELTVRLTSADEEVIVQRLSWAQVP